MERASGAGTDDGLGYAEVRRGVGDAAVVPVAQDDDGAVEWGERGDGLEQVEAVAGHRPGRRPRLDSSWHKLAVEWVTRKTPRDFGFLRSRWCCEAVAVLMGKLHQIEVGRETVQDILNIF